MKRHAFPLALCFCSMIDGMCSPRKSKLHEHTNLFTCILCAPSDGSYSTTRGASEAPAYLHVYAVIPLGRFVKGNKDPVRSCAECAAARQSQTSAYLTLFLPIFYFIPGSCGVCAPALSMRRHTRPHMCGSSSRDRMYSPRKLKLLARVYLSTCIPCVLEMAYS